MNIACHYLILSYIVFKKLRGLTQNTQWEAQMFFTKAGPRLLQGICVKVKVILSPGRVDAGARVRDEDEMSSSDCQSDQQRSQASCRLNIIKGYFTPNDSKWTNERGENEFDLRKETIWTSCFQWVTQNDSNSGAKMTNHNKNVLDQ